MATNEKREGREVTEPPEFEPGPDGCIHLLEKEMQREALTRDAPAEQPKQGVVIHVMELQMKGDGVAPIDPTPPDPEAPIDSARKGSERPPIGANMQPGRRSK